MMQETDRKMKTNIPDVAKNVIVHFKLLLLTTYRAGRSQVVGQRKESKPNTVKVAGDTLGVSLISCASIRLLAAKQTPPAVHQLLIAFQFRAHTFLVHC
jgi:hypothetical protein